MSKVFCWAYVGDGVCAESFGAVEKPYSVAGFYLPWQQGSTCKKLQLTWKNITYSQGAWWQSESAGS